ncbi:MAG: hypothetical protein J0H68_09195 [Sphingobacteriia bacterium]|nr:hypothetical protein [Sphingobacteriia bacterium]
MANDDSEKDKQLEEKNEKINSLSKKQKEEIAGYIDEFIKDQKEKGLKDREGDKDELVTPETLEKLEAVIEKLKSEGNIELTPEELDLLEKLGVKKSWMKKALEFLTPKLLANFILDSVKTFFGLNPKVSKGELNREDLIKDFEGKAEASKAASNEKEKDQQQSKEKGNDSLPKLGANEEKVDKKDKETKIPFDESATKVKADFPKAVDKLEKDPNLKEKIEGVSKNNVENNVKEEKTPLNQEKLKDNKQDNSKDKDQKQLQKKAEFDNDFKRDIKEDKDRAIEDSKLPTNAQKFNEATKTGEQESKNQTNNSNKIPDKVKGEAQEVGKGLQGKVTPVKGKGDDGKDPSPPPTPTTRHDPSGQKR